MKLPGLSYYNLASQGELMVEDSFPSCHGADVMHNRRLYKDVVELINIELALEQIQLKAKEKPSRVKGGKEHCPTSLWAV